jgi:hypothetical protein
MDWKMYPRPGQSVVDTKIMEEHLNASGSCMIFRCNIEVRVFR